MRLADLVALAGSIGATALASSLGVAALASAGCGGLDHDDFAAELRDATCGHYVRCGSFASIAECRTYLERFATSNASFDAAVDAGRIHYDEGAAQACIDALDALACEYAAQDAEALAACDEVFTGAGRVGSPCAFDAECTTDRCVVPACDDACCTGTCGEPRAYPGLDEPCTTVCADDLFCGQDQICHAPLGVDEPCDVFTVCAEPLYCSPTTRLCAHRPALGEPCDSACASEGDVCATGICVEAALGGDDCDMLEVACSPFYTCNLDTRKCELPVEQTGLPNGSLCDQNIQCESRYCDAVCMEQPICI